MNPIAGFLTGLAGGAMQSQVTRMEEDRQAQLRSGKMIMDMVLSTGDVTPMKMLDQKILKSFGVDPAQIDALGQMLAPVRQEREAKLGMQQAQMGVAQAQQRKLGAEASETEATSAMIGGLSPEEQKIARVPELGKAKVQQQQADAATTSAQASMVKAERDLTFEQRLKLQQNEINAQFSIAAMRKAAGGGSDVEGRAVRLEEMKAAKTLLKEFSDEVATSDKTIMEKLATKNAKGQPLFADEATASAAAALHNAKVARYKEQAGTFQSKYGMAAPMYDEYEVVPITEPSMLSFLGKGPSVTGFTLRPRQAQAAQGGAAAAAAPKGAGDFTLSPEETAQMEKLRQRGKK